MFSLRYFEFDIKLKFQGQVCFYKYSHLFLTLNFRKLYQSRIKHLCLYGLLRQLNQLKNKIFRLIEQNKSAQKSMKKEKK